METSLLEHLAAIETILKLREADLNRREAELKAREQSTFKTYTPTQAAEILQCDYRTVLSYINSGELKASRIGKTWVIREEELMRFVIEKEAR